MNPEDVVAFWIGELDQDGFASPEKMARWWRKDPSFDAEILATFGATWSAIMRGAHDHWRSAPRSLLAFVMVLDQFSRNMFRGKSQAFAGDGRALSAARDGVARGADQALVGHERLFLYMPFMHSESLSVQEQSVALFTAFRDQASGRLREELEKNLDYALLHRDIIARWGRFPHRNQLLDRTSTAEELAFLQEPNSSF